jgi:hypothetical protein
MQIRQHVHTWAGSPTEVDKRKIKEVFQNLLSQKSEALLYIIHWPLVQFGLV